MTAECNRLGRVIDIYVGCERDTGFHYGHGATGYIIYLVLFIADENLDKGVYVSLFLACFIQSNPPLGEERNSARGADVALALRVIQTQETLLDPVVEKIIFEVSDFHRNLEQNVLPHPHPHLDEERQVSERREGLIRHSPWLFVAKTSEYHRRDQPTRRATSFEHGSIPTTIESGRGTASTRAMNVSLAFHGESSFSRVNEHQPVIVTASKNTWARH